MLERFSADIPEDDIMRSAHGLLSILLFDRSANRNIIWATDDYRFLGESYQREAEIRPEQIAGEHAFLIRPRTAKAIENQQNRVREKAEVFTPSWICNEQNNLIDDAWFGRNGVFNIAGERSWQATTEPISFPDRGMRTWKHYVDAKRMEISCGEAPYLVSRYDATTGERIPIRERIGLLDRKLRVVGENTGTEEEWTKWAVRAVQSVYGFEFQGDSLLLARENVFAAFMEYHFDRFDKLPGSAVCEQIARVISWNLWQMDGLKYVCPYSCRNRVWDEPTLIDVIHHNEPCPGCQGSDPAQHTGVYCKIMDWRAKRSFRYIDLMKGAVKA